jgi:ABC-type nitrate/sulfonate/bicarbonate transport system ATPase subunit
MASLNTLTVQVREKRFPIVGEAADLLVLQDLAFEVPRAEFVCLIGPSGCGKTTLLNMIAGLDQQYRGAVRLPSSHRPEGPRIGYVFQNPRLLPWRTVLDNVLLVLSKAERSSGIAEELLEAVGLWESRHFHPTRLSLGMQRRVALARAYAVSPDVLLMDEPFVSLDGAIAQRLRRLLVELWQRRPTTVLFVTHDLREAIMLADRLLILAPRPSHVIAETRVSLARTAREDRAAIEELRPRIIAAQPDIFDGMA